MGNNMKSIETLIKLSKNPFYKLSEEEAEILTNYMNQKYTNTVKHTVTFDKNIKAINKHKTGLSHE